MARAGSRRRTVGVVGVVGVALVAALGAASCGSEPGTATGTGTISGDDAGRRYLVLPEDTPGFAIADEAEEGYGSALVRADSATIAMVRPSVMPGSFELLTEGRATATLANGLEVAYVCGGRGVSGPPQDDPTGDTVINVNGPLTVIARVEGGVLIVEDTPTDTSSCTQPTEVEGPLVDVAATLRWVDEAEFRRLLAAYPNPERQPTPPTTR